MTQKEIILEKLRTGAWFSLADALHLSPPIYRLSERCRELKAEGYEIESRRVEGKPYSEYRLRPPRKLELPPAFPKSAQALF